MKKWPHFHILLFSTSRASCGLIAQRPLSESTTRVSGLLRKCLPGKMSKGSASTRYSVQTLNGHDGLGAELQSWNRCYSHEVNECDKEQVIVTCDKMRSSFICRSTIYTFSINKSA